MTTLLLENLGYPNTIIPPELLDRAIKLGTNFVNAEQEKIIVLEKFLYAAADLNKTAIERNGYFRCAQIFCMLVSGCGIGDIENYTIITIDVIKKYIQGCREDAFQGEQISRVFKLIQQQVTINIDFLATFSFLLNIHYDNLKKQQRIEKEFEQLCSDLLQILDPFVAAHPDLVTIYAVCCNSLSVASEDERQMICKFNSTYTASLIKCYQNIANKHGKLVKLIKEHNGFTEQCKKSLLENIAVAPQSLQEALTYSGARILSCLFNDKKCYCDCFTINLENYKVYAFGLFYECAAWYKKLNSQLVAIKSQLSKKQQSDTIKLLPTNLAKHKIVNDNRGQDYSVQEKLNNTDLDSSTKEINLNLAELDLLRKEADQYIEAAKSFTAHHRGKQEIVASNVLPVVMADLEQRYNFSVTQEQLLMRLKLLNLKHLTSLDYVFDFKKKHKLTFAAINDAVVALGGKIKTFDGSKTQIFFPGGYSTASFYQNNQYKLCGGFHKRHNNCDNDLLEYVHADLIKKALKRAGGIHVHKVIIEQIDCLQTAQKLDLDARRVAQGSVTSNSVSYNNQSKNRHAKPASKRF